MDEPDRKSCEKTQRGEEFSGHEERTWDNVTGKHQKQQEGQRTEGAAGGIP